MELIRTPKDMDELFELIEDMRGSQSDLARVAIMAQSIGFDQGVDAAETAFKNNYLISERRAARDKALDAMENWGNVVDE
tara:strand:+ start:248 stop:487 length:240 start_codon:yes stop_codon:yes gene_type:complete